MQQSPSPEWDMYTLLHHYPMWEVWLNSDPDKEFLLDVILQGLWISEKGIPVKPFALPKIAA